MAHSSTRTEGKKAGTAKILIALVFIIALMAIVWAIKDKSPDYKSNANNGDSNIQMNNPNSTRSPDRVKESGGPSSDTTPSSTGTGPGSDKSLLGQ